MDKQELKTTVIEGCDRILGLRRIIVSNEEKKVVRAQKRFWENATDEQLEQLLASYQTSGSEDEVP